MARLFKPMNPALTEWSGKVVWIVGASTGIGRAVAEQLAQRGARVMVSARQSEPLQQFATQHPGAVAYPLDVTDLPALQNAVQHIVHAQGRLDLVLFAAGIYKPLRAYRFDLARMKQHLDVNVVGAYNLVRCHLAHLIATRIWSPQFYQQRRRLARVTQLVGIRPHQSRAHPFR